MIADAVGQVHETAKNARILSLVPSITELLFTLGLGEQVVGRTAFCIHPKDQVKTARSIGGTKEVNLEKVKQLNATHLVVNIDENPKELVDELSKFIPHVIVTHPNTPGDNIDLFRLLGDIFEQQNTAARLISEFQAAHTHAQMTAMELPPRKVMYFIWNDPWMTVSSETYIAKTLAVGNLSNIQLETDRRYPEVPLSQDLLDSCDAILFSSEPFAFKQSHLEDFARTYNQPAEKLHFIDGEMTSWYGSRAIQGMRYICDFAEKL